jgi:hypothetical protein
MGMADIGSGSVADMISECLPEMSRNTHAATRLGCRARISHDRRLERDTGRPCLPSRQEELMEIAKAAS